MIAFIRGMRTPLSIATIPASARTVSNSARILAVPVADHVFHPAAGVFEIHRQVAGGVPCQNWFSGGLLVF
ncbi:hypothetical protein O7623_22435 [Solwaraspora sp. WMMD791]|uniref:hypothetical protein n=1 Tax=Solwaraspora sp. WMMD791 TaxID=3016086 RepID=UPI00249B4641|nr:hypothetical protein [Solwaraspora sp. WMMD791]WFE26094.1 hypothetical protein O7623_22435 [Solwaraspora sp. WMMD791]